MRTAIVKTDFWKEDKIFNLLPDARFFYLCLLTNPERNTTAAFKCSDRLLIAFTGYNTDVLKMCKKELIKHKLIEIIDDYYIIGKQDFVSFNKGKLTAQLYEKDLNSLPLNVQVRLRNHTGAAHEPLMSYIYINSNSNSNKDSNINTKDNSKSIKQKKKNDINEFLDLQTAPFKQTLIDFIEFRKANRKPLTLRALQLLISKVQKLYPNDMHKQIESLNQSIMNGWQGVFSIKEDNDKQKEQNKKFL